MNNFKNEVPKSQEICSFLCSRWWWMDSHYKRMWSRGDTHQGGIPSKPYVLFLLASLWHFFLRNGAGPSKVPKGERKEWPSQLLGLVYGLEGLWSLWFWSGKRKSSFMTPFMGERIMGDRWVERISGRSGFWGFSDFLQFKVLSMPSFCTLEYHVLSSEIIIWIFCQLSSLFPLNSDALSVISTYSVPNLLPIS